MPPYQDPVSTSHRQLRNVVADRLREAILNGEIKPGEWLRQERLAVEYNVSQMPIREAFKELTAEGLVEHIPYRGVRVVEFSSEDIADLYACRAYIEGMAVRAAALNITAEELGMLKELLVQMRDHLQSESFAEYHDLNRRFHRMIILSSRRTYLVRTLNQMWDAFPSMLWNNFYLTANRPMPSRDQADIEDHEQLVAALERRDAGTAESIARHHIEDSGRFLVEVLRGQL